MHSCRGFPPFPLYGSHFIFCHIQDMAFFSRLLKKMPPAQAPYLASRGVSPRWTPPRAVSVDTAQGALPLRPDTGPCADAQRPVSGLPRAARLRTLHHTDTVTTSASVTVLLAGGFVLGAPRPQTPRQGASPLHSLSIHSHFQICLLTREEEHADGAQC